jgi:hypothetical protein
MLKALRWFLITVHPHPLPLPPFTPQRRNSAMGKKTRQKKLAIFCTIEKAM